MYSRKRHIHLLRPEHFDFELVMSSSTAQDNPLA